MKIRNRNGRSHAAFSALATPPSPFGSATRRSLASHFLRREINPLDKYCPAALLRRNCAAKVTPAKAGAMTTGFVGETRRSLQRDQVPARCREPRTANLASFAPKTALCSISEFQNLT
jgi:hypothetical protein